MLIKLLLAVITVLLAAVLKKLYDLEAVLRRLQGSGEKAEKQDAPQPPPPPPKEDDTKPK
ncbi:MAG: hypothetical protein ONB12_12865 [candidate division KSB1 bacterium]|nr:hypothetical protein [candidate division KSB1 bacterium]